MFRKRHTDEDILIKRVSTELRAFVDLDPELEAKVMDEVAREEGDGVELGVPNKPKDPNEPK